MFHRKDVDSLATVTQERTATESSLGKKVDRLDELVGDHYNTRNPRGRHEDTYRGNRRGQRDMYDEDVNVQAVEHFAKASKPVFAFSVAMAKVSTTFTKGLNAARGFLAFLTMGQQQRGGHSESRFNRILETASLYRRRSKRGKNKIQPQSETTKAKLQEEAQQPENSNFKTGEELAMMSRKFNPERTSMFKQFNQDPTLEQQTEKVVNDIFNGLEDKDQLQEQLALNDAAKNIESAFANVDKNLVTNLGDLDPDKLNEPKMTEKPANFIIPAKLYGDGVERQIEDRDR